MWLTVLGKHLLCIHGMGLIHSPKPDADSALFYILVTVKAVVTVTAVTLTGRTAVYYTAQNFAREICI